MSIPHRHYIYLMGLAFCQIHAAHKLCGRTGAQTTPHNHAPYRERRTSKLMLTFGPRLPSWQKCVGNMFYVRGSDASAEGTHDAHDANGAYRKWGRRDFSPVGDAAARVLPLEQSRGFLVSCGVDGGVLSTPGHSPDSVSVVLDSGDVFVGDLCPSERVALFPNPAYRRSWETLLEHDTRRVHFAHWPDEDFQGATPARMRTPSCTNRRTRHK